MAVSTKRVVICSVTPCSSESSRRFGATHRPYLQGGRGIEPKELARGPESGTCLLLISRYFHTKNTFFQNVVLSHTYAVLHHRTPCFSTSYMSPILWLHDGSHLITVQMFGSHAHIQRSRLHCLLPDLTAMPTLRNEFCKSHAYSHTTYKAHPLSPP
jgi:hypothetical protein